MKKILVTWCLVQVFAGALRADPVSTAEHLRLIGGHWYETGRFVEREMWVLDGRLWDRKTSEMAANAGAARVLDLDGGYVIPPFGEAHNHNLGFDYELDDTVERYLEDGVFYVKILSNLPRQTGLVRHRFGGPRSVDVAFAGGGLTASGGHPIKLRESLLERGAYPGFDRASLADHAYFVIDAAADLETRWPRVLQYRPDFLKIFLVSSEEYEKRRDDPEFYGARGLDPSLVPAIVDRAHRHGLRVSAHVNSAHDFRVAVEAGADEIAHLPGFRQPTRIAAEDAARAAARGTVVVTTASLAERWAESDPERYARLREAQRENLRRLVDAGVTLAVGSDDFADTSRGEVRYLQGLDVFSPRQLLDMWAVAAPRTIFPERRVGCLESGCEASFLVLDGNPLEDFAATGRIQRRVKDGVPLE